jgi:hypothetical protein
MQKLQFEEKTYKWYFSNETLKSPICTFNFAKALKISNWKQQSIH